ncbi:beta-Ig-H3/fasciclin [Arsukibacterium ikkense]|uniref:Beta-Ig-H3/fasciclin n=1 Tax=Arsukibacterium ikkense TaxID=336831 RepID=A0A0M2V4R2_9GAMM|nr:fasciclin domain-containing protein [Arsukibacterium ikkense]KKO45852.1 beta-Ig-H3/fasciclin [Arsukibacterium ikkense]
MKLSSLVISSLVMGSLLLSVQAHNHKTKTKADIVDTAIAAGSFTTLVTAVQAADLVDTLKGTGPFTVFAPNDAAFAKIPAADLNALVADKAALTNVLTYHVVAGKVMAADVVKLSSATTVQGQDLSIEVKYGKVFVNGAEVIATDIETSNGVIHVLDSVVLPKN